MNVITQRPTPSGSASSVTSTSASTSLETLERRLRCELRGEVAFDAGARGRYATDASIYQMMPLGVVVPRHQEDLALALEIAREAGVAVLPRGGGTSQCGQTVNEALVIDTSRWLTGIGNLDLDARTVEVEPGVVLDHLNAWLKPHGLWFPVDVSTSAQCTLGGMAGNNSCGSRSIRYGNMVHNVASLDATLADGRDARFGYLDEIAAGSPLAGLADSVIAIARREAAAIREHYPQVLRRVGGYNLDFLDCRNPIPYDAAGRPNLAHLLIGSEGTLAFTRRLTLKLSPLPVHKVLGVINFPTFYQAMDMTQHIVALGPAAVELVDGTMIELALANPAFRPTVEKSLIGRPDALLLVEFAGENHDEQRVQLARLEALMGDLGLPGSVVGLTSASEQAALWNVRKAGLNIMMSMKGDGKPVSFIEDCAVPLEHLAEYTDQLTEVFHRYGTEGTWYAHASVGTLHVRPILDMRRGGAEHMRAIAEEAAALVRRYKGAYSGEHGDGICRGEWIAWQFGEALNAAFGEVKRLFDPDNRFNPNKIVDPPKMDDARLFRFPSDHRIIPVATELDWSAWNVTRDPASGEQGPPGSGGDPAHGLAKAVEMCNNNGHCRKFDAGTMCPSYRIGRDERHVTRGRANTLRLVLSGAVGREGLASDEVAETLDLCVSCKGCKRDCPTGVDMAKFKIEARAARLKVKGLGLRERLVSALPRYAPWMRGVGGLAARLESTAWLGGRAKRALGFAEARALPAFGGDFLRAAGRETRAAGDGSLVSRGGETPVGEVLLFVDTFNNYFEPDNARAARRVLEAAGYRVHLNRRERARPLCCGRTYLAAGRVSEAKREAERTLAALMPYVERGVKIVGLEPSCLLTLRDEFLHYGFGERAERLAAASQLFEEFLVAEREAGRFALDFAPLAVSRARVHGHCHQKAFDAFSPVMTVLGWIPDFEATPIISSCCGMAGSFGYEAEHYEASQQMAELSLLPAVRDAGDDAWIVADGTSCRHQIRDGAAREALHVARILEAALPGS